MDVLGPRKSVTKFSAENPFFCCVISHTETSSIPGLTVAGANPEILKYTSPADAEFLHYGYCRCIDAVPATPDGKPTPAVITRAALDFAKIPFLVVDSGAKVKPDIPCIPFGISPGGNITKQNAVEIYDVKRALEYGHTLGRQLARSSDLVVVGESIPGGTTTALAVLCALGIDAQFMVSSSMPQSPHDLKNRVVRSALVRAGIYTTNKAVPSALEVVSRVGDPMMPTVVGIAAGALEEDVRVMFAGGTQMCAVLALMRELQIPLSNVCIGTTVYVTGDPSADLIGLAKRVCPEVPVLASNLHLEKSRKPGLQAFANGYVKEGVGAGGLSIAAMMKTKSNGKEMLAATERVYEHSIECKSAS
jgi:uncharacterized protein (TIGR00303 family)